MKAKTSLKLNYVNHIGGVFMLTTKIRAWHQILTKLVLSSVENKTVLRFSKLEGYLKKYGLTEAELIAAINEMTVFTLTKVNESEYLVDMKPVDVEDLKPRLKGLLD